MAAPKSFKRIVYLLQASERPGADDDEADVEAAGSK